MSLRVRDTDESVAFYCNLFGLEERKQDAQTPMQRVCVAPHRAGMPEFGVVLTSGGPTDGAFSGLDHFTFDVPTPTDVETLYKRARQCGAAATRPRVYGGYWQSFIFDPDGYKIQVRTEIAAGEGCGDPAVPGNSWGLAFERSDPDESRARKAGRPAGGEVDRAEGRIRGLRGAGRQLVILLAWMAACAAGPSARGEYFLNDWQPGQDRPAVVADTGGPIREIVLHFDPDSQSEVTLVYRDLFAALPGGIRLQVMCPTDAAARRFMVDWGIAASGGARDVQVIDASREISIWARDRRIARQRLLSLEPARIFVPADAPDYWPAYRNELELPELLTALGMANGVVTLPIELEGGNVVSNERHAIIGPTTWIKDALGDRVVLSELLRVLGRPVICVTDRLGSVPWAHVDMFITPVDDDTVLVASLPAGMARLPRTADGTGSPDPESSLDPCDVDDRTELVSSFDDIAALLDYEGYTVRRLPALMNRQRQWMVTYNNVLMERGPGRRVVYMPTYGLPSLDEAAARIYRSLGFEVRTIDVSAVFRLGGAVRCLVNVTQRASSEVDPAGPAAGEPRGLVSMTRLHPDHMARNANAGPRYCCPLHR